MGYEAKLDQCSNIVNGDAPAADVSVEHVESAEPVIYATGEHPNASPGALLGEGEPEYTEPW